MDDLIKRQDAIRVVREYMTENQITDGDWHADGIERELHELPSAEPVIRCKDCKWCSEHYDTDGNAPYWICRNWDGGTDADGFCYEAERRTDEADYRKE